MAASSAAEASFDWLKQLQAQFLEGKFTDAIIRVTLKSDGAAAAASATSGKSRGRGLAPAAKRRKTAAAAAAEKVAAAPATVEIPCHANVLAAQSSYFRSCLGGKWREAQAKTVELELDDEQQLADFRLLLKLAYMGCFTKDRDEVLDRATRLRLAVLADRLEMGGCVAQCLKSLADDLTFEQAIAFLDEIPEQLQQHAAMNAVKEAVVGALVEDLAYCDDEELLRKAGDALARCLGPIHTLIKMNPIVEPLCRDEPWDDFYEDCPLVLNELASTLSFKAMKYLLQSEKLQCLSENEPHFFLGLWMEYHGGVPYSKLAKHLRFEKMDAHYVGNVLTTCPLLRGRGMSQAAVCMALLRRDADQALLRAAGLPSLRANRSMASAVWSFETAVHLQDCLELDFGRALHTCIGVAAGYPVTIAVGRSRQRDQGGSTFVLALRLNMPTWHDDDNADRLSFSERSVRMEVQLRLAAEEWRTMAFFVAEKSIRGWSDAFGEPWEEVVREGSPHFVDGKMNIEFRLKVLPEN